MKKILLVLAVVAVGCCGLRAEGVPFAEKLLFYIPNRLADAMDSFSVNLGVGPVAQARLMGTRACDVGAGIGMCAKAYKVHNRQYGFGIEEGWYWSFIFVGEESYSVVDSTPLVARYVEMRAGFPEPTQRVYDFFDGPRDYWAIGGALGCLVDGEVYIHPVEMIDFALGFFFVDIKQDDFSIDDFR